MKSTASRENASMRQFVTSTDRIELVTKTGRDAPSHKPCTGRATIWCRHIGLSKANTSRCNGINVWCRNLRVSLATEFAISQVVCNKDNDVRLTRPEAARGLDQEKEEDQRNPTCSNHSPMLTPALDQLQLSLEEANQQPAVQRLHS